MAKASRPRRSIGSGKPSTSSLTAPRPSSSRPILRSSRRCATLSGLSPPERALVLLRRRKEPNPGAGSNAAAFAHAPGANRAAHPQLYVPRNSCISLFAALDAATGKVIGRCYPRHRGREFLSFLREIERKVAANLDIHLIMDNYATHKTEPIRKWLGARPRWHVHFTPTASSWVNQVERFFADVTEKQIRRGVHRSTAELETAIRAYLDAVNADPKPFRWTNPPTTFSPPSSVSVSKPSTSPQPKPKSHKTQNQDTSRQ
jgi:hypothetical protein